MAATPAYESITVDRFLATDFPEDRKYELVDGVIRMMGGGSPAHARVSANILGFLYQALRGSGCRPYGSDMGLRMGDETLRYPDVSVYCGDPVVREADGRRVFDDPVVLFEVLSPSTVRVDLIEKLAEYREIDTVQTVVFVDPDTGTTRVVQRLGPLSWRDDLHPGPHDVELPSLGVTIPHAELFA